MSKEWLEKLQNGDKSPMVVDEDKLDLFYRWVRRGKNTFGADLIMQALVQNIQLEGVESQPSTPDTPSTPTEKVDDDAEIIAKLGGDKFLINWIFEPFRKKLLGDAYYINNGGSYAYGVIHNADEVVENTYYIANNGSISKLDSHVRILPENLPKITYGKMFEMLQNKKPLVIYKEVIGIQELNTETSNTYLGSSDSQIVIGNIPGLNLTGVFFLVKEGNKIKIATNNI